MMSPVIRRTPLFGKDGYLGSPTIKAKKKTPQKSDDGLHHQPPPTICDGSLSNKTTSQQKPNPSKSIENKSVNFPGNPGGEKKREKFLTAKYGAHQMGMIRKRLKVELWMFDQLQILCQEESENTNEVDIDLDEVLDIEDEKLQKKFIREILINSKSSTEVINQFVNDLLERAKTL